MGFSHQLIILADAMEVNVCNLATVRVILMILSIYTRKKDSYYVILNHEQAIAENLGRLFVLYGTIEEKSGR